MEDKIEISSALDGKTIFLTDAELSLLIDCILDEYPHLSKNTFVNDEGFERTLGADRLLNLGASVLRGQESFNEISKKTVDKIEEALILKISQENYLAISSEQTESELSDIKQGTVVIRNNESGDERIVEFIFDISIETTIGIRDKINKSLKENEEIISSVLNDKGTAIIAGDNQFMLRHNKEGETPEIIINSIYGQKENAIISDIFHEKLIAKGVGKALFNSKALVEGIESYAKEQKRGHPRQKQKDGQLFYRTSENESISIERTKERYKDFIEKTKIKPEKQTKEIAFNEIIDELKSTKTSKKNKSTKIKI